MPKDINPKTDTAVELRLTLANSDHNALYQLIARLEELAEKEGMLVESDIALLGIGVEDVK